MNGEKMSLQLGDETANSTKDAHCILTITLIQVTQIDLFAGTVVTDLERAQAGNSFNQSRFLRGALGKCFLGEAPVNTSKSVFQSKCLQGFGLRYEIAAS
jgi:hypothetical protein